MRNVVYALFVILLLPQVFQLGLFTDGLCYSSIAQNLSQGNGTFWFPSFSETLYSSFHEHPPLGFFLQSLFFRLFGDAFWVEKLFSFCMALLTAILIIQIWKTLFKNDYQLRVMFWIPLLLWLISLQSNWAFNNNLLENILCVFSLGTVFSLLKSQTKSIKSRILWTLCAAVLTVCSFLTKGFVGLFPLGFFFCYWLCHHDYSFSNFVRSSFLLFGTFAFLFASLLLFKREAWDSLSIYLNTQVFESLSGTRMSKPWWHILRELFIDLSGIISLTILVLVIFKKSNSFKYLRNFEYQSKSILFILIGLSASLPIAISPKQLSFYIVPSIPFFAIGFAILMAQLFKSAKIDLLLPRNSIKMIKILSLVAIFTCIAYSSSLYGTYVRDKDMIQDVQVVADTVQSESTIGISVSLANAWSLMGYFSRFHNMSLSSSSEHHRYKLVPKGEILTAKYLLIPLELKHYDLYKTQ